MIQIIVVSDGDKHFAPAVSEYEKRLSKSIVLHRIKPEKSGDIHSRIRKETNSILSKLSAINDAYVVLLSVGGKGISTEALCDLVSRKEMEHKHVVFVIGGAYGCDENLIDESVDMYLSLSDMTFPHGLALLSIIEQIYRVKEIQKGSGYHH